MRRDTYLLNIVATTGAGEALSCQELSDMWFQVTTIVGAVGKIEGTIDGTNWVTATGFGTVNAAGVFGPIVEGFTKVRFNRTTQGTSIVVTLSGKKDRGE